MPETLWLRLLGKDAIRQQAIEELFALPTNNILRDPVLKLIRDYLKRIEDKPQKTSDEKELFMELSPAYLQWEKETLQKGRQQIVENLLKLRFGGIDKALAQVIEPLLQLSPDESSRLLLQSSREDLLTKFIA